MISKINFLSIFCLFVFISHAYEINDVSSISLEKTNCLTGDCPIFTVTFRRSSTVNPPNGTYVGVANVPKHGVFDGHIRLSDYNLIASLLLTNDFFSMNTTYGENEEIYATVFVQATLKVDSETIVKRVTDYHSLYQPLEDIQSQIQQISDSISWEKSGKSTLVTIIAVCVACSLVVQREEIRRSQR